MKKVYLLLISLFSFLFINNYCLSDDTQRAVVQQTTVVIEGAAVTTTQTSATHTDNTQNGGGQTSDKDGEGNKAGETSEASEREYAGINIGGECLSRIGKNCFTYEKIVGIDDESKKYTALSIIQDVIFAATYMVGTVLTVVIIWCGLGYILAARGGKDTNAYKKGLKNGVIGAILVLSAYTIVRLIQYIAKG